MVQSESADGAVAIGGFLLVEADNTDFAILGDPRADLVLLLGLIFVFGVVLFWLDRRLPEIGGTTSIVVYSLLVAVGVPFLVPVLGSFFSSGFCFCENPPIWTGIFLASTSIATIWWWKLSLRSWETPPATGLAGLDRTVVISLRGWSLRRNIQAS